MKVKKSAKFWIAIALIICLISSVGACLVQSSGGRVEYHDVTMVMDSGHEMDALLLVPENATRENPAPAIVVSHGWYNNREMQDLNYVEYARRGYVVMSISMYGHGDSEVIENGTWWEKENNANGMYDAVRYLSRLPFVDSSRIGVTGHSNGGLASRNAMLIDDEGLISAALIVSNDSVYYDEDKNFANPFGNRDVGIVACQYDEFFHRTWNEDGTHSSPRDFLSQPTAQSFLNFGVDPDGLEARSPETFYTQEIDGKEAIRVIFNPNFTHPWAHFSKRVVADGVNFFEQALGAPNPIEANNQIWQWKAFFNAIGLIGFFMFIIYFAIALLDTKFFSELKAKEEAVPLPAPSGKGKAWYWGGLAICAVFAIISYPLLYRFAGKIRPDFFNQAGPFYIGLWTLFCGLFTLIVLIVSYKMYSKKNGLSLTERGIKISGRKLWKTILISVIVAAGAYAIVFVSDYFFLADYRLWCWATVRAFAPFHFALIGKFLVFWLVYYIVLSVATNCFNYVKIGKNGWGSVAIEMLFVFLGPIIMIAIQYLTFWGSGYLFTELADTGSSIIGIWLYPIAIILPLAAFICNKIYRKTNNPYIGGIIMGIIACVMAVTNTLTLG